MTFDVGTLDELRRAKEVRIRPDPGPGGATIWVVVAGDDVFIRSVTGERGKWYRAVAASGRATLEADGRRVAVRATRATDPASVERASREFLAKYQGSPYAAQMVRPEVLRTTLRVEPAPSNGS